MDYRFSLDLCLAFMVGGFIGARIFHVLYEQPHFYWENPQAILMFWIGGFVYFGGAIGAFTACWALIRYKRESFLKWADLAAPILAFGYSFGRIGCFLAGCCFGKACDLPWAVSFPQGVEAPAQVFRHPTQLYATIFELLVLVFLLWLEKKPVLRIREGFVFFTWMCLHGVGRLFMEYFRDDYRGEMLLGWSISSWFSMGFILIGTLGLTWHRVRKTE